MSLRRTKGVNRPSFSAVAADCLDEVYRYVLMLTADASLAEDLTSATFEKALTRWRRFDPARGSATTWLCAIARNTALDHFRSESRRRRREDTYALREPRLDSTPFAPGLSAELEEALQTLTAGEREVIALRVVLDLDAQAAADVLGISRTACSMRLGRALQKLEERMKVDALA
jgi:RNA polymerase sigma-70 factor (ECF subfamily)